MEVIENYQTSDIVLASYLCLVGFEVAGIECVGNKGTFVFNGVPQKIIDDFDLGSARVEPVGFNSTIRRLTTGVKRKINEG